MGRFARPKRKGAPTQGKVLCRRSIAKTEPFQHANGPRAPASEDGKRSTRWTSQENAVLLAEGSRRKGIGMTGSAWRFAALDIAAPHFLQMSGEGVRDDRKRFDVLDLAVKRVY